MEVEAREWTNPPGHSLEASGSEAGDLCNINRGAAEDVKETGGRPAEEVKATKPRSQEWLY